MFKNIRLTRYDLGPLMRRYAEEHNIMPTPRRMLVGSYRGDKSLLLLSPLGTMFVDEGAEISVSWRQAVRVEIIAASVGVQALRRSLFHYYERLLPPPPPPPPLQALTLLLTSTRSQSTPQCTTRRVIDKRDITRATRSQTTVENCIGGHVNILLDYKTT